ncbi:urease accessory protein UreD [Segnochrobactraceae bacterium EtOH-i3]
MTGAAFALPAPPAPGTIQRARGRSHVGFARDEAGRTRLADLFQAGCAKIRLPRIHDDLPTAVLLNTSGGLTGGDHVVFSVDVAAGAAAIATTQAAERIYRRLEGSARVEMTLSAGAGATLNWLPQETILFERSALDRTTTFRLTGDATLVAVEAIILGRAAMGEVVESLSLSDTQRIEIDGRLVFADRLRLDGNARAILTGRATGAGATAFATVLARVAAPDETIARIRALLDDADAEVTGGASIVNGIVIARLMASDGQRLRSRLMPILEAVRAGPLPRVWHC